jgi:hypothetical protein
LGDIYNPNFTSYKQKDIDEIFRILTDFFNAIEKKDLMLIQDYILEEKGIYTDLKSWKSKKDFLKEIQQKDSYINNIYLNTNNLIQTTNDPTQLSLYDLIQNSRQIKTDFFILTEEEC